MKKPTVSVLMTTYNPNLEYLKSALDSIYMQTYSAYEIILVDDGSKIDIRSFLEKNDYKNLCYIQLEKNVGITKALNIGLLHCRGKYIARMDDDDISTIDRLEKQVKFLEENKDINIIGSNKRNFGENTNISDIKINSLSREQQQVELFFSNIGVPHPSLMIRKSFFDSKNINYNENYKKSQDYGLWVECSKYTKLYCLPDILLFYRCHKNQISSISSKEQLFYKDKVRLDQLKNLNIIATDEEKKLHIDFCMDNITINQEKEMLRWIRKLYSYNKAAHYFNEKVFEYRLFVKGYFNLKDSNKLLKFIKVLYIFKLRFILQYFGSKEMMNNEK